MSLDLNICPGLQNHPLLVGFFEFISSIIKHFQSIKASKHLIFWPPSTTCPFITRSCYKCFTFVLFSYILFFFRLSPIQCLLQLIGYSVTTSSIALTDRPNSHISTAYSIYCLVLLKTVLFGLVSTILLTFSNMTLHSVVDSASSCFKLLSTPNASVNWPWIFTFLLNPVASFLLWKPTYGSSSLRGRTT